MASKKHYVKLAADIKEFTEFAADYVPETKVIDLETVVSIVSELLQKDNPLFDYDKFRVACGI